MFGAVGIDKRKYLSQLAKPELARTPPGQLGFLDNLFPPTTPTFPSFTGQPRQMPSLPQQPPSSNERSYDAAYTFMDLPHQTPFSSTDNEPAFSLPPFSPLDR